MSTRLFIAFLLVAGFSCRTKKILVTAVARDPKPAVTPRKNPTAPKQGTQGDWMTQIGLSEKKAKQPLYRFIRDWYGVPYRFGGCQKSGVDCSCFVDNMFDEVYHTKLPRNARDMFKVCDPIQKEEAKEGDLVFFAIGSTAISHVGVCLGNNYFVHASTSKGVIVSSLNENYYQQYFFAAGKVKKSTP